ncbi:MAG: polyamine aminopropyltransferase, partial [Alphaproteobacteria bacterium]|nr:polyamine aminopropyltransferase [Alphaproteobacteria bacterium]
MTWFEERLYDHWRQSFLVEEVLFREQTEFQDLIIFKSRKFGRVLALDGVIQVCEGDEFVYHEMLSHVPLLAHGAVRDVAVVGGGDGGILREALKHPIERATLIEIDPGVIEMCRRYMPGISAGAFDDPRVEVVIADGVDYMSKPGRLFDVIVIDSTDPIGPGEVLFTESFYADCKKRLKPRGIVVNQNGVPFLQDEELRSTHAKLKGLFGDASFFVAAVPTYVGGLMTLGWATDDPSHRRHAAWEIDRRFQAHPFPTRYWNPDLHVASFALPQFVRDSMA